jgi:hypothetical protein
MQETTNGIATVLARLAELEPDAWALEENREVGRSGLAHTFFP